MLGCENITANTTVGGSCFAFLWGRKSTVITVDLILVRKSKKTFSCPSTRGVLNYKHPRSRILALKHLIFKKQCKQSTVVVT